MKIGPAIVTDKLILNIDASSFRSYTGTGTTWYNLANDTNHGTILGTPTYVSGSDAHFILDGTTDKYFNFPDINEIELTDVTISLWFKMVALDTDEVLLSKGSFATTEPLTVFFDVSVSGGDVGNGNVVCMDVVTYDGTTGHRVSSSSNSITDTKVQCLDIVINPTANKLLIYIDGVLDTTSTKTWNGIGATADLFKIGASTTSTFEANCNVYNSKIYLKALSPDEILQNYNVLKARYL